MKPYFVKCLVTRGWASEGDIFRVSYTAAGNYKLVNVISGMDLYYDGSDAVPFHYKRVSRVAVFFKKITG